MKTEEEIEQIINARRVVALIAHNYFSDGRSFEDFTRNERVQDLVRRFGLEKELDHIFYLVWRRRKYYD